MDLTHKTILSLTSIADLYLFNFFKNAEYERCEHCAGHGDHFSVQAQSTLSVTTFLC